MVAGYYFSFFSLDQRTVNCVNTSNFPGLEDVEIFKLSVSAKKQGKYSKGQIQGECFDGEPCKRWSFRL